MVVPTRLCEPGYASLLECAFDFDQGAWGDRSEELRRGHQVVPAGCFKLRTRLCPYLHPKDDQRGVVHAGHWTLQAHLTFGHFTLRRCTTTRPWASREARISRRSPARISARVKGSFPSLSSSRNAVRASICAVTP